LVQPVLQGLVAFKEPPARQARLALSVQLAQREVQVLLARPARQALPEHPVFREHLVVQVQQVLLEPQVLQEHLVSRVLLAQPVLPVPLDLPA
jgi:hypothetical protein